MGTSRQKKEMCSSFKHTHKGNPSGLRPTPGMFQLLTLLPWQLISSGVLEETHIQTNIEKKATL